MTEALTQPTGPGGNSITSAVTGLATGSDSGRANDSALVVADVVKRYGSTLALDGINLALSAGELLAVVGPSGCGKSTLLRGIAGLTPPDSGRIVLGGELVDDGRRRVPPERRGVGLVFQDHSLFPHLTVADNVGFGLERSSKVDARTRIAAMLELVGLDRHGDRFPHELSGGERQRVALARALAPKPALMLFDEPFASIDQNLRSRLRADVVAALRATGTASMFVTHDQSEALAIGDRIAVMRAGQVVQLDAAERVFHRPVDSFVGAFMGTASFLPIEHHGSGPRTELGPIEAPDGVSAPALTGGRLQAMVRPDDLRFVDDKAGTATVVDGEYHGSGWLLTLQLDSGRQLMAIASHLDPHPVGFRGRVELVEGHRQVVVALSD